MLIIAILSVTDKRNGPPPPGLVPLALFFTILGIGLGLGMETGYAINPARDLGPRILTAMVGYGRDGTHFMLDVGSVFIPPSVQLQESILDLVPYTRPYLGYANRSFALRRPSLHWR